MTTIPNSRKYLLPASKKMRDCAIQGTHHRYLLIVLIILGRVCFF